MDRNIIPDPLAKLSAEKKIKPIIPVALADLLEQGFNPLIIADVFTLAKADEPVPPAAITALNAITEGGGIVVLKSESLPANQLAHRLNYADILHAGSLGKLSTVVDQSEKSFKSANDAMKEILDKFWDGNVVISIDVTTRDIEVYLSMVLPGIFMADVVDAGTGKSGSTCSRRFDLKGRESCIAFLEAIADKQWRAVW